jgi:hypothetical protein
MKVGSIGPTMARCLKRLGGSPTLAANVASERDATISLDDGDDSRSKALFTSGTVEIDDLG